MPSALVFGCAFLLDGLLGDPPRLYHPVQAMGAAIAATQRWGLPRIKSPGGRRLLGAGLTAGLAGGCAAGGWLLIVLAAEIQPWLGAVVEVVLMAACFATRSLAEAAGAVAIPLAAGDLPTARRILARYVGRDTEDLDEGDIARAVVETVAENTTDGVTAPLFYAALGGAPLALAFKAVSTLDSMIGYRDEPYTHFGWFAARSDDWLNWIPARLTALTVALLSGRPGRVLAIVRRDAHRDASPNSGVSIAAYAGALDIQLGGLNRYRGIIKKKPTLGDAHLPLNPQTIRRSVGLLWQTAAVWAGVSVVLLVVAHG
ncbi:adenosylcobinamide-phosphate synthase CbiB [Gloeobacter morelensis]|uniref:Cobalamin biosynthesis protein CobD n=1 Tax=Gloeobacter morelensis MG652769 TaxID=2781736 RepID=A0ABY3PRX0_9CYAN|nr:adenosylcobinamide-phosphate synthase CbiB [Gloeobacter morelensis]UFP96458.1 cobalamin biosynthesis protein CobD [Gloeobacter morelensis MG652769]